MADDTHFQAAKRAHVYLRSALNTAEAYLRNPRGDDIKHDFSGELEAVAQRRKELVAVIDFTEEAAHSVSQDVLDVLAHAEWECTNVVAMSEAKRYTNLESSLIGIRRHLSDAGARPYHH
jgi:hypothetical protein